MKNLFRKLSIDEIELRVQNKKDDNFIRLLLYKDARADMKILDETVGAFSWKREHFSIDNKLYCKVSIFDKATMQWINKEDVGTESYTEKEKGQASDSFKRACTNWGIGRELYTAPSIMIWKNQFPNVKNWNYIKYKVSVININEQREITGLQIIEEQTKTILFNWGDVTTNLEKINKLCNFLKIDIDGLKEITINLFDKALIQALTNAEQETLLSELKKIRNNREIEKINNMEKEQEK